MGKKDTVLQVLSLSKPCFHQEISAARAYRNSTMKVLLSLTALCIAFGLCHGACFEKMHDYEFIDGHVKSPDGCVDDSDGTKHPFGDIWNSADCMRCSCGRRTMSCCTRYGGIEIREGCKSVLDMETCSYKFYKTNDPTTLCDI